MTHLFFFEALDYDYLNSSFISKKDIFTDSK